MSHVFAAFVSRLPSCPPGPSKTKYDSEQPTVAKNYVENWKYYQQHNSGLLFWGDVGTGKSYLAACIANALIDREVSVRMITLADVLNHKKDDIAEFIQELCSPSLLILDDIITVSVQRI